MCTHTLLAVHSDWDCWPHAVVKLSLAKHVGFLTLTDTYRAIRFAICLYSILTCTTHMMSTISEEWLSEEISALSIFQPFSKPSLRALPPTQWRIYTMFVPLFLCLGGRSHRRHTVVGFAALCMYVSVCLSVCLSAGFLVARRKPNAETSNTS